MDWLRWNISLLAVGGCRLGQAGLVNPECITIHWGWGVGWGRVHWSRYISFAGGGAGRGRGQGALVKVYIICWGWGREGQGAGCIGQGIYHLLGVGQGGAGGRVHWSRYISFAGGGAGWGRVH